MALKVRKADFFGLGFEPKVNFDKLFVIIVPNKYLFAEGNRQTMEFDIEIKVSDYSTLLNLASYSA